MRRSSCIFLSLAAAVSAVAAAGEDPFGAPRIAAIQARLARAREVHLDRLHAYAMAGRFPRNETHPGVRVPVFIDRHGSACAVAHLMRESGRGPEVESIARSANHVRVMEVRAGPLVDWITDSGLLQEECAIVQPSYEEIYPPRGALQWNERDLIDVLSSFVGAEWRSGQATLVGGHLVLTHTPEVHGRVTQALAALRGTTAAPSLEEARAREIQRVRQHLLLAEARLRGQTARSLDLASRRLALEERLRSVRVGCEFERTPLREVAEQLRSAGGIDIVLYPPYGDARRDPALVTLRVRDLPLRNVLNLLELLVPGLTIREQSGVLVFQPRPEQPAMVVGVYDLRDLLVFVQDFPGPLPRPWSRWRRAPHD